MNNDATKFLNHIGKNYNEVKKKIQMLCARNKQAFSEDTFHTVIVKCHQAIEKKGTLNDTSPYGIEAYLIRSYFNQQTDYKRVAEYSKRDWNYNSDNIHIINEQYQANTYTSAKEKIASDLYKDFATLYLMLKVEQNFDPEHFYVFRIKELCNGMTYKKLRQLTNITAVRQKVITVRKWLQNNVTKEEITNAFNDLYGELI